MQPEVSFRFAHNEDGVLFVVLEFKSSDGNKAAYPFTPEVALALAGSLAEMGQEALIQNNAAKNQRTIPTLQVLTGDGEGDGIPSGQLSLLEDEDPSM